MAGNVILGLGPEKYWAAIELSSTATTRIWGGSNFTCPVGCLRRDYGASGVGCVYPRAVLKRRNVCLKSCEIDGPFIDPALQRVVQRLVFVI